MTRDDPGPLARRWEIFLALRYLRARRKQAFTSVVTVVSILGIAVGVSALVIALALLTGFQEDIQAKLIGATAHITIFGGGEDSMPGYEEVVQEAESVPGVVAAAPTVLQAGLLQGEFDQAFAVLKGVRAGDRGPATDLLDRLVEGDAERLRRPPDFEGPRSPIPVVLGADLARRTFYVEPGDRLRLMVLVENVLTPLGTVIPEMPLVEVVGVFEAGMYEYDNTWVLMNLADLQELFGMGDTVSYVEVRVEDFQQTEPVMSDIQARIGEGYWMQDWKQMNELFFSALSLEKLAMFVTISLIVFVAALNIAATLVLMVMEKNRDIGILLSMGATRKAVLYVFMAQGLIIGLLGTGIGLALGTSISWVMDRWQLVSLPEQVYYLSHVPFIVRPFDFTTVALLAVAISFLATLYPAWRASKLDPVEALRYE